MIRRWLRAVAYGLAPVALSLCIVTVTATDARADYWDILRQVRDYMEAAPSTVTGEVVETVEGGSATLVPIGEDVVATVSGTDVVTLGLAGLTAYNGTCWALGKMVHNDSRGQACQVGPAVFKFGDGGDDRSAQTGTGLTDSVHQTLPPGSVHHETANAPGPNFRYRVDAYFTGHSGLSCIKNIGWYAGSTGSQVGYDVGTDVGGGPVISFTNPTTGATALTTGGTTTCGDKPYHLDAVRLIDHADNHAPGDGYVGAASIMFDPAPPGGVPWSATYTETCENASGTATATKTVTWTPTANSTSPDPALPSCDAVLPGSHVKNVAITGGRTGQATPDVQVSVPTFSSAAETQYPLCTTKAPADGCRLDLLRNGKSCFADGVYCAGWMQNETRWDMTCEWGPYPMELSVCEGDYGTLFDLEPQPNPTSTTAPTPTPSAGAGTGTGTGGSSLPTTGSNPGTGTGQDYDPEPNPDGSGAPNPESSNCWGTGWSWNPISWVYVPVKCALSWAFVPTITPTGISAPSLGGWSALIPTAVPGGTCEAKSIDLELPSVQGPGGADATDASLPLPDTCAGTIHGLALTSYGVSALFCTMGAVMFVVRRVGDET